MNKRNHLQKVRMARRMMSNKEIKKHIPIFESKNWEKRKESRFVKTKKA